MEAARSIREDYLHQNAFDDVDTYTSPEKQLRMLSLILSYYDKGRQALDNGANLSEVLNVPVRESIGRSKYIPEAELARFTQIENELNGQMAALGGKGEL